MASIDLTEYIARCKANPEAANGGSWYARSSIHHNGQMFSKGMKLPDDLKNGEVAQLLEVNAVTSVAPADNAASADLGAGEQQDAPSGQSRLDENGNEVQE